MPTRQRRAEAESNQSPSTYCAAKPAFPHKQAPHTHNLIIYKTGEGKKRSIFSQAILGNKPAQRKADDCRNHINIIITKISVFSKAILGNNQNSIKLTCCFLTTCNHTDIVVTEKYPSRTHTHHTHTLSLFCFL